MGRKPIIREIVDKDLNAITAIQAEAVLNGVANFNLVPLTLSEMKAKKNNLINEQFPFIVAEVEGTVRGFAYVGPHRPRPGYRWAVEDSIYVLPEFQGHGIGSQLLDDLIRQATHLGFRQMVAVIGDTNNHASIELHRKYGFQMTGTLKNVGYKHGQWLDVVIMQLELGAGVSGKPDESVYPGTLYKPG